MTEQIMTTARLAATAAVVTLLVAGCTPKSASKAPVEHRGTDPSAATTTAPPTAGGSGIVTNGTDRYVVAEKGDTVATLASRNGLSASALAGYNGLTPDTQLFVGQDLVVPPGAVSSGGTTVADAGTGIGTPTTGDTGGTVESRPLPGAGGVPVNEDGTIPGTDGTDVTTDGTTPGATSGGAPRWSPELAADAIARSGDGTTNGETGLKEDGRLGPPTSSTDPVPEAPASARNLESPGLGQYQTKASSGDPAAKSGPPPSTDVAAVDTTRKPAAGGTTVKLQRPVSGPIAVGFGEGAGAAKNDGVDFAAAAGAPVVAAADGEVALVSETLGGLGTIVLVRHKEELLTVYGRIDNVGVKKGDIVRRGQKIGVVAEASAPDKSRMHFEVRRGATVLDPMGFL